MKRSREKKSKEKKSREKINRDNISRENKKDRKKRGSLRRLNKTVIFAVVIFFVLVLILIGRYEIMAYEDSVLAIYADQQDAYVQLVLDQINVQENRTDEEIITKILSSLDTSNRKYWTLSKNQALLFVKDITETNRYKGFTTATYFVSDSATEFLQKLTVNQVVHEIIEMDKEQYVASGVIFEYNHAQYKICLLTNETVILDNNIFLSSKISLYIYLGVLILSLMLAVLILTNWLVDQQQKNVYMQSRIEEQNRVVEKLENKLENYDFYHTRFSVFHERLLPTVIRKLNERNVCPVTLIRLCFSQQQEKKDFLEKAQVLLDESVLRFGTRKETLTLVFVNYQPKEAAKAMHPLLGPEQRKVVKKIMSREDDSVSLMEVWEHFCEEDREKR